MLIPLEATAEENITVSTTPVGITPSILKVGGNVTVWAIVEVVTQNIRYSFLGGTPTGNDHLLQAKDVLLLTDPLSWRAVRDGAVDAVVKVTVFQ